MDVTHLQVLVIGLGVSGKSAARFLLSKGASVFGIDDHQEFLKKDPSIEELRKKGLVTFLKNEELDWGKIELVVVSPGISPDHPVLKSARLFHIECIGEVELACRFIKAPCIGITGTNGKTTVTLFMAHLLNVAGRTAVALGNVGVPLTAQLSEDNFVTDNSTIYVIELSSFQLETMKSKVLDSAVILNITPDHMDRYHSFEDYVKAKMQIANCLKENGKLFVEYDTLKKINYSLPQKRIIRYGYHSEADFSLQVSSVYYRGSPILEKLQGADHDKLNQLVAFAACREFGVEAKHFLIACSSFKKPPHRVEFVEQIKGVSYYDDSKGTNIDAVIKAVDAFSKDTGKIYLIAGGVHKGASYHPWKIAFHEKVAKIFAIGEAALKIKADLDSDIPVEIKSDLEVAVQCASKIATNGDIVLLSPGCSSYDMFKDYKERGEQFRGIVRNLK